MNNTPINRSDAAQAVAAMRRLTELESISLITRSNEQNAEILGLQKYLSNFFLAHANQFLACYFAVVDEYEVMLQLAATFMRRLEAVRKPITPTVLDDPKS